MMLQDLTLFLCVVCVFVCVVLATSVAFVRFSVMLCGMRSVVCFVVFVCAFRSRCAFGF